ncbi:BLUF domain-containing protein [Plastoroseomonas arctica]|uniref:BLUF domain-containing protein n=1 Tax=Plastoroseomonas arctica TaxID=1509237 RepID=A0AAF1K135_9PROT|nr:BLUF domain-containing protein [Plastoroseomonas arctica]MBR0654876.1 BLUF domain-containing protein [Plastoroseomonas arctica]
MRLGQLIYTSRPFGFDAPTLDDILLVARANNARSRITGALICRADLYMQLLEGPRDTLTDTFGRILRDDRHLEVRLVHCSDAPARLFPEWSMRDDPPHSWMWTQEQVRAGAARDALASEAMDVFARLATLPRGG